MKLNNNTFIIYNKYWYHAKLDQWGTKNGRSMGTTELDINPDQFWILEKDERHSDYFYIKNANHRGYRIGKWSNKNEDTGIYKGQYATDQLWRFERIEDDYYKIYNYKYKQAKMAKWSKKNGDWGTYPGKPTHEDTVLWKLVPRYKAKVDTEVLWHCDNRNGSRDVGHEVDITKGINLTKSESNSVSTTVGFKNSLKLSLPDTELETEFNEEIENSISVKKTKEKIISRTTKTKFTAPKSFNYRVLQHYCKYRSPLESDNCELRINNIKTEQRKGKFKD